MRKALLLFLASATTVSAQATTKIRPLGAVSAVSADSFRNINGVRHLPGGNLLVNDVPSRRVVLLDPMLRISKVVADTTSATASAYSGSVGGLIPWKGDSTLFVDPQSLSMLMLDPEGKVARVLSVPRAEDAMALAGMQGPPGIDASGRLIYRGPLQFGRPSRSPGGVFTPPTPPESLPIVRVDLATRAKDTLGFVKVPKIRMNMVQEGNRVSMTSEVNPLPLTDDWTVTSNGVLAMVRGQDYHVDWVHPDGRRVSSPKIPFDWQRLSDEDKVAFIDSVKAARARMAASSPSGPAVMMTMQGGSGGGGPGGGGEARVMVMGGDGPPPRGGAASGAGAAAGPRAPEITFIPPAELPDYKPPFFVGAVRADADGNVWVRTIPTRAIPGGPVYDVINEKGELIDRVQVPADRTIVGFGPGGIVYLAARVSPSSPAVLERASVR